MKLKINNHSKYDIEREIVAKLIVDTEMLRDIYEFLDPTLFVNTYSKHVIKWIREYYAQTKEAPNTDIQTIFLKNKSSIIDQEVVEDISTFLQNLSADWERYQLNNTSYNVESIKEYLRIRNLENITKELDSAVKRGDVVRAETIIGSYKRVDKNTGKGINLFQDAEEISTAFNNKTEELFTLNGALGRSMGSISRGELIGILGPTKVGKSWFKLAIALHAAKLGLSVVYFNLELVEAKFIKRAWKALNATSNDQTIKVPFFIEVEKNVKRISYKEQKPLNIGTDTISIQKQQKKLKTYFNSPNFKIITKPRGKTNVEEIEDELAILEMYEGFQPDVVIVDYAGLLSTNKHPRDNLAQEDYIWETLAGLAQKKNISVITSTQGNRLSWDGKKSNIEALGGYAGKLAHVGKFIGLSASDDEKEKQIVRIRTWFDRDKKVDTNEVIVLNCLEIGQYLLDSEFKKNVEMD